MNDNLQQALMQTLDHLMKWAQDGTRPGEARARLCSLQQEHPNVGIDLVWEEEAYDQSVHYDALLRIDGQGTVALSFCPDRALPWPMRGVQRTSERSLVRVNTTALDVYQAIACLDFIWDEVRLVDRLIHVCLIQEALEKDPIELSDAELQVAMDAFRRSRELYTAEHTYRWMERHGLTHEQFERLVADEATIAKLRERVTAGRVDAYFDAHRTDFDTVAIAQFDLPDRESACHTCDQIRSGEVDFYDAAQRRFLAEVGRMEPLRRDLFAVVQRRQMTPELGAAVFFATPSEVLGPLRIGESFAIIRILSSTPACLNDPTRSTIKKILFEEWLAQRRQAATIEWYWGNAGRTSQACDT